MPVRRSTRARRGRRGALVALLMLVIPATPVAAAACDASSSPSPQASPSASAGSRPLPGTPREAAAEYWRLVDADDGEAMAAASVPGAAADMAAVPDDIAHVRLVSARAPRRQADGSVELEVTVYVEPAAGATPWGAAGVHTLFMEFEEAPSGGWLLRQWGTGP